MKKVNDFILKTKWLTADSLTASRFIASLPLLILVVKEWYLPAFFVFVIFSLTDIADGYVARLKKTDRKEGMEFDGITDMIFFLPSFLIVGLKFLDPAILFTLLAMEILRGLLAFLVKILKFKLEVKANWAGKVKAWFEGFGLGAVLFSPVVLSNLANIFFAIAIGLAVINILLHLRKFFRSIVPF
jgi:phosphatidylglycerophosphate synthase